MRWIIPLSFLALLPGAALAATSVFSCDTTRGKQIVITRDAGAIRYSFGKPSKSPELTLSSPIAKFDYRRSLGIAMEDHYLGFVNGATRYILDVATLGEEGYEANLTVSSKGKELAIIRCRDSSIRFDPSAVGKAPVALE